MRFPFLSRALVGLGLLLAACGLLWHFAGAGAGTGHGTQAGVLASLLAPFPAVSGPSGKAPKSLAAVVEQGRAEEVFARLFAPGVQGALGEPGLLEAAQKRFEAPYTLDSEAHQQSPVRAEISARLGILKALGAQPLAPASAGFLRKVAGNPREHWLVQRQAIRDLLPWMATAGERERLLLMGGADPRAVSSAGLSEREMLAEIVRDSGERNPADSSPLLSINEYEKLPCPTPEQFASLAQAVRWKSSEPYACDASHQGKLGRLLLLLESLDLSGTAPGLRGPVVDDLRRPWAYFTSHVSSLSLDLHQATTNAYNLKGAIRLGAYFFTESPLMALETLIHEARHSDSSDPGHVTCVQGDIPGIYDGCDFELTDGAHAGGYSYGMFFLLELAGLPRIAPGEREFLLSEALAVTSQRFNRLPPRFAQFIDGIVGTDTESRLIFFHPFARYSYPISTFLPKSETIHGLDYDDRTGGAMLFTSGPKVRIWNWERGISPYFPQLLGTSGMNARYANKLGFARGIRPFSFSVFTDEGFGLHFVALNPNSGLEEVRDCVFQPAGFKPKSFCLGALSDNYFLAQDGHLWRLGSSPMAGNFSEVEWAGGARFRHMNCGVLHDSLYAVGEDGLLYRQSMELAGSFDQGWVASTQGSRSELQAEKGDARSYHEGTQLRALLDDGGSLRLQIYRQEEVQLSLRAFGRKITDFTFFRLLGTQGALARPSDHYRLAAFGRRCGVDKPVRDPWLGLGVGVSAQGYLLFEGRNGECVPAALPITWQSRVESFSFGTDSFGKAVISYVGHPLDKTYFFAPVFLQVKLMGGEIHRIRPYQGWSEFPN